MDRKDILRKVKEGQMTIEEADEILSFNKVLLLENYAKYDFMRERRTKIPEIVYAEGKTPEHVIKIIEKVLLKKPVVLASRITENQIAHLEEFAKKNQDKYSLEFGTGDQFCLCKHKAYVLRPKPNGGRVGIITAGTSDIPVAEEAKIVIELMGTEAVIVNDIGVAGIHRLFEPLKDLLKQDVDVIIVAAGMEGALPTVIAGLVDIPVIGLPISVGYGFGGKGETALRSMLQSCALGLAVVNIDSGVNAGAVAAKIAQKKNE